MSRQYCVFFLVIILLSKFVSAARIPLKPLMSPILTYKPSTLLLPSGFDSQKSPLKPMLYPYAVASLANPITTKLESNLSTTPGWVPISLKANDLPLAHPLPVLEDRISNDEPQFSLSSHKEGPVFESIVYGTWKPDPPLQPVEILNVRNQQRHGGSNNATKRLAMEGNAYNKIINRQHGGFIGEFSQKSIKAGVSIFTSTPSSNTYKRNLTGVSAEYRRQRKFKNQGRRKIHPIRSITKQINVEKSLNTVEAPTVVPGNASNEYQQNVIMLNSSDPKLTQEVKEIVDSIEINYNHNLTSTHSADMTTKTNASHDRIDKLTDVDNDKFAVFTTQWTTKPEDGLITEVKTNGENTVEMVENKNATGGNLATNLTEALSNYQFMNKSDESQFKDSLEANPAKTPLILSELNIPPSLWPNFPGNITKLGKPYAAESSSGEFALCVPITVREQNLMNLKEPVYIEHVFCFPPPQSFTTSENVLSTLIDNSSIKEFTTTELKNFDDLIDSNSKSSNESSVLRNKLYLVIPILAIYLNSIA